MELKWLTRLPPPPFTSSAVQRTHPSLSESGCIPPPRVPVHLSLLNEAGMLPVDSGVSSLKLPPCWEFELAEGGASLNMSKPETCHLLPL